MFNENQQLAINHNLGPMLVLAGPGSGKTTVITHRIKNLIDVHKIDEKKILVITFTVASAKEMKERYETNVKGAKSFASFGTFHSIFFTILRYELNLNANNILKPDIKYNIFKEFIREFNMDFDDEKELISGLMLEISKVKENLIDIKNYFPLHCSKEIFINIYNKYTQILTDRNLIDFDDMQVLVYKLFSSKPNVLKKWQDRFSHILIDEFQDINTIQYAIIKMLCNPLQNIFIVGDDDQSIYQFRGANPKIMLNFPNDFPNAQIVKLNINYRSTKNIVQLSSKLISHNKNRYPKDLTTLNETGCLPNIKIFDTSYTEYKYMAHKIIAHIKSGVNPSDIAILVRTNSQPAILANTLIENNIKFNLKDNLPSIFDHWIAKDLLAYINLAYANCDTKSFTRIMNKPLRYISKASIKSSNFFSSLKEHYRTTTWMLDRIYEFENDVKALNKLPIKRCINYIRKIIGYDKYIKTYAEENAVSEISLIAKLDELEEMFLSFNTYYEMLDGIEKYTQELKESYQQPLDVVQIMTLHSCKGLEFKVVYIPDVVENIIPHSRSKKDLEIEEERRLFYVGMTRAIKELNIYSTKELNTKSVDLSRFILELGCTYENNK